MGSFKIYNIPRCNTLKQKTQQQCVRIFLWWVVHHLGKLHLLYFGKGWCCVPYEVQLNWPLALIVVGGVSEIYNIWYKRANKWKFPRLLSCLPLRSLWVFPQPVGEWLLEWWHSQRATQCWTENLLANTLVASRLLWLLRVFVDDEDLSASTPKLLFDQ